MKILHIAESYASGVAAVVQDYVASTPTHEHHLLYAARDEAPISDADLRCFASAQRLPNGHLRRLRHIRSSVATSLPDVVHAHSSFAGVYVRSCIRNEHTVTIAYTPHCFAFERLDVGRARRAGFRLLERALMRNTGVIVACGPRELRLALDLGAQRAVYVPNIWRSAFVPTPAKHPMSVPHLVAVGRLSPQKDPEFFADIVQSLRQSGHDVEATWVGGGDGGPHDHQLEQAGITVTGWMPRERIQDVLSTASYYVHTARWEGFPMTMLEAHALRVPVLARRTSAFDGLDLGYMFTDVSEVVRDWPKLISKAEQDRIFLVDEVALAVNTPENQSRKLAEAYALRKGEEVRRG